MASRETVLDEKFAKLRDRKCFLEDESKTSIECLLMQETGGCMKLNRRRLASDAALNAFHAELNPNPCFALVYSLSQTVSATRINITETALKRIVNKHHITPDFLKIVSAFHQNVWDLENAYCAPFVSNESGDIIEYAYVFKYAELNFRKQGEPWSLRQTGVYHQYHMPTRRSVDIILNPVSDSSVWIKTQSFLHSIKTLTQYKQSCFSLHKILLQTYTENWLDYMSYYEKRLNDLAHKPLEPGSIEHNTLSFSQLATLSSVTKRYLPLPAAFSSTKRLIVGLREIAQRVAQHSASNSIIATRDRTLLTQTNFNNEEAELTSYEEYVTALLRRCSSTSELISNTLNLRHQGITSKQSSHVVKLTERSVDDSATVRVITVISLAYLSFTLIATIFAMPFFRVDDQQRLRASPQVWIYLVVSIPLTFGTIGYWRIRLWIKKRKQVDEFKV